MDVLGASRYSNASAEVVSLNPKRRRESLRFQCSDDLPDIGLIQWRD
jgi:hypothetical protein